jgi:MSHA biogenesis protein MshN
MSVLNRMLEDLERRDAPERHAPQTAWCDLNAVRVKEVRRRGVWLVWPLVIALATVGYWQIGTRDSGSGVRDSINTQSPAPAPQDVAVAPDSITRDSGDTRSLAPPVERDSTETPQPQPGAQEEEQAQSRGPESRVPDPVSRISKTPHPLTPAEQAELAYQDALRAHARGRHDTAATAFGQALELDPRHAAARAALAALHINAGRTNDARTLLDAGLRLERAPALAQLQARLLMEDGELDAARAVLTPAPSLAGYPDTHALIAALDQRQGRHQDAATRYQALVGLRPDEAVWWLGLALSREALGDASQARAAYTQARARSAPDSTLARYATERLTVLAP